MPCNSVTPMCGGDYMVNSEATLSLSEASSSRSSKRRAATDSGTRRGMRLISCQVALSMLMLPLAAGRDDKVCSGWEEEWNLCKNQPPCVGCIPRDCQFSQWSSWSYYGGCTKLCHRTRGIQQDSNDCGKPCNGTEVQTKRCDQAWQGVPAKCTRPHQNCVLGQWEQWFPAKCTGLEQKRRVRKIVQNPKGDNPDFCTGVLEETAPCGFKPPPVDCQISTWTMWSTCDRTCGGGYSRRSRKIISEAKHQGTCPHRALEELEPCNENPCEVDVDCQLSAWTSWTKLKETEMSRSRQIIRNAVAAGKRCKGRLFEIKGTPPEPTVDCQFTEWQPWTSCTKACGTGQQSRSRSIRPWTGTGHCPSAATEEQRGCNFQLCGNTCHYSFWSAWSACSVKCGSGTMTRSRIITTNGFDCDGNLTEAAPCSPQTASCIVSTNQPCVWGDWKEWEACSKTCGGGQRQRSRQVQIPPGPQGAPCDPKVMSEAEPCGEKECNPCIDGLWSQWTPWTVCSVTCDVGLTFRSRKILRDANYCGVPAVGDEMQYKTCEANTPCVIDVDCELGSWSPWSICTPHCFGVTERRRPIIREAQGHGKACVDSTKEIKPCNPGVNADGTPEVTPAGCFPADKKDCLLSDWNDWTTCTAACGGTQRRYRHITQLPMDGMPCHNQSLSEVQPCSTASCIPQVCTDCRWSQWGQWSMCGPCHGQQTRSRVVEQLPNYCGTKCDKRKSEETRSCRGNCEKAKYCIWDEWAISESCPQPSANRCEKATYRRSRSMILVDYLPPNTTFLAKGTSSTECQGYQTSTEKCPSSVNCKNDCIPVDCGFGPWGEWSTPTCTGICERSRSFETFAKCGGKQCEGVLVETKSCTSPNCEIPQDCKLGPWSFWSPCGSTISDQKNKQRAILEYPKYGGKQCPDHARLNVTVGCWEQEPQDCVWEEWSLWGKCSKSCGSGIMKRHRGYAQNVQFQGEPCEGRNQEVAECNTMECPYPAMPQDCQWDVWSDWQCGVKYSGMKTRSRGHKLPLDSLLLRTACEGLSEEMMPCNEKYSIPEWAEWSPCTKTCGGGQKHRHRAGIIAPPHGTPGDFPKWAIPEDAVESYETAGCAEQACDPDMHVNCSFTSWEPWTPCSSTCGPGQKTRLRTHMSLRHKYGYGCTESLMETAPCEAWQRCPAVIDCQWGMWADWSACNAQCGGGEKQRVRSIAQSPQNGGKQCEPRDKEEVAPCNEQVCHQTICTDGMWAEWLAWSQCSLSCDPGDGHVGIQKRRRGILQYPSDCGTPLEGESAQLRSCKTALCPSRDCVFNEWSQWSGCSIGQTCGGYQTRKRTIAVQGFGPKGKKCKGPLEETIGCDLCDAVQPVDCQFSPWETVEGQYEYDGCTVSCGGGRMIKKRHIAVQAQNGGKACEGALQETKSCNVHICPAQEPIDCAWSDWSDWGKCDVCGPTGQRLRSRHIKTMPKNGGKHCEKTDSEQMTKCDVACPKTYCTWGDWQPWGACSASCGHAQRSRRRYLETTDEAGAPPPKKSEFSVKYEELQAHIEAVNSTFMRDLIVAFFMGGVAFLVGLTAIRLSPLSRYRRRSSSTYPARTEYSCMPEGGLDDGSITARELMTDGPQLPNPSLQCFDTASSMSCVNVEMSNHVVLGSRSSQSTRAREQAFEEDHQGEIQHLIHSEFLEA